MPPSESRPPTTGASPIRRSLFLHSPIHRMPRTVLRQLLDQVDDDTPPGGPDAPVARLERRIADLLGTESALFFPTGTMAQQVALRIHAERHGRHAFAAHPQSHLDVWEQRGYHVVHGLRFHPVGDRHRLLTGADLAAVGEPLAAVVWELPQRDIGGQLPEWDDLRGQVAAVRERGAAAHLDGARLWEAQTYYRRPFAEIAGLFDTVYTSLYKSLLGIRGAILAADAGTVAEATAWRARLGGAIHDAWPLALAGLAGLDNLLPRMPAFREHAITLATAINADGVALAWPDPPQTPIFHIHLPASKQDVERAGEEMIAERGVQLFARVLSGPDPARCSFEVTVGEQAMAFAPEEVVALLHELLDRAGSGQSRS
ncbi:threonine aldolase family protein [Plantactinospora endophytica]|uniref:Threonine aldolase n=1 Tax=Plantactinospora endophytica TaxID=673535 RepID=A0ABQ4DVT1_9ACTN|nr:beta-eliminating lyase-related protein [Plantactinospora endophytica]GIG86558.1 threonine aldolase [Plantactinospora endophytica]